MKGFHLLQKIQKKSKKVSKAYDSFSHALIEKEHFAFFGLFLCAIFFALTFTDIWIKTSEKSFVTLPAPVVFDKASLYPLLSSVLGASTDTIQLQQPVLSASSAVVMDNDSKTILYDKNKDLRFSMASTTKIMTALTALSYYKLDDILTVQSETQGSLVGFTLGEKVRFVDLLYGMLLPSGNDAALAIGDNYPGGVKAFVEKMNQNAKTFYLLNTHFSDPAGLDDNGNFTTASDLAHLASIAMQNPVLSKTVSTTQATITDVTGENVYVLHNLNKLLGYDGVNGIKTGFTDEAGGVLVTSKQEAGHTLIIVVMKSVDRFADTLSLLQLVSGNIQYIDIASLH